MAEVNAHHPAPGRTHPYELAAAARRGRGCLRSIRRVLATLEEREQKVIRHRKTIIAPSVNAGQGWRKRRDSNPRYLSVRSLSSRRGAVCRGMSSVADLRGFARSVWRSVGDTAVGCYTAATRRHQSISPAASSRTAGTVAGLVVAGDQLGRL